MSFTTLGYVTPFLPTQQDRHEALNGEAKSIGNALPIYLFTRQGYCLTQTPPCFKLLLS